jgi:hypothetical protein
MILVSNLRHSVLIFKSIYYKQGMACNNIGKSITCQSKSIAIVVVVVVVVVVIKEAASIQHERNFHSAFLN